MAKRQTLTVTLPDGKIDTRTTTHDYTHVVAGEVHRRDGAIYWQVFHWAHSKANALKYGFGIAIPVNSAEETKRLLAEGAPKFEYPEFKYTPQLMAEEWEYACRDTEQLEDLLKRNSHRPLYVAAMTQYLADRRAGLEYAQQIDYKTYRKRYG